ncbi:MAG TPA: sucrase ferredoxin [Bryobacteraceae bacterium]|nr:sucrase ferredoxin [Bryobacteraceae bacterium]
MAGGERFFCALESQKNGEEIFGTVAHLRSWLLLEYPGAWRRNAVEDSRLLSPAVREHMLRTRWDRSLLIRQEHKWEGGPLRAFTVDSSPESPSISQHLLTNYEQVTAITGPGEPVVGNLFAVCTHARHDRCCAKFGNAVWCALRDAAPERAWQCSHVGGDRFAANVVLMPHGIYYGRVRPEDVGDLLRASDAGQLWLPGYRGRSGYRRAVQAAEYFLRRESGVVGFTAFKPLGNPHVSGDITTVVFEARADGSKHRIEYRTVHNVWQQRLTCHASEESGVTQHRLIRYTVES